MYPRALFNLPTNKFNLSFIFLLVSFEVIFSYTKWIDCAHFVLFFIFRYKLFNLHLTVCEIYAYAWFDKPIEFNIWKITIVE